MSKRFFSALGVGLVAAAFTVPAPAVAIYAASDIVVGVTTGATVTDRIGNGIDSVINH